MSERTLMMTDRRIAILRVMLAAEGAVTATIIAKRTGIHHATINGNLRFLEDHGWVLADRPERRQGLMRRFILPNRRAVTLLLAQEDN